MDQSEAQLLAKYGGLKPKRALIHKEKKCFDSADYAMAKEGKKVPGAIEGGPAPACGAPGGVPDVHHAAKIGGSHLKPSS